MYIQRFSLVIYQLCFFSIVFLLNSVGLAMLIQIFQFIYLWIWSNNFPFTIVSIYRIDEQNRSLLKMQSIHWLYVREKYLDLDSGQRLLIKERMMAVKYSLKLTNDDKRHRSILCKDTNIEHCLFRTGEHIYVTAYLVLVNIFRLLPI